MNQSSKHLGFIAPSTRPLAMFLIEDGDEFSILF